MRVVLDTNVLLAAFLTEGVCAKLLTRARHRDYQLYTCPFIIEEFERILAKKFSASQQEIRLATTLISEAAYEHVVPTGEPITVCRDALDNNVLACADVAQADYLVSGDKDLLILKEYRSAHIILPREFELLFEV